MKHNGDGISMNSIDYIDSSLLPNGGRNQQICNYTMPAKSGNVCAVDINNWGPCSPNQQYGFNNSAPCVFIKLNRVRLAERVHNFVQNYFTYKNSFNIIFTDNINFFILFI